MRALTSKTLLPHLAWAAIAVLAAYALAAIALHRGEPINSVWLVVAALCAYSLGYRFYARFIALRVMRLDPLRATPAERLRDGYDYEPSNKWILFGHHFAAIAGPGPLVGPTLAAQFGYLPGALWIVVGAVLGGAVQDFVILFCSIRRDGKSLGQIAREETGRTGGFVAMLTVLVIMIILLAVVGLVVVNALKGSPWGAFTIAATIPIALFIGLYLRYWRPGRVLEGSALGFFLILASIFGGQAVSQSPALAPWFTFSAVALTFALIAYGFLASALPVWLLLAPRDYLSTFIKLGVVFLLAAGVLAVHPQLQLPALTRFTAGDGPIFAGKIFPFCFITIACGAISGFHALISSGTTPKMIASESDAPLIGYGSMLLESFVAIMALVAAASLQPGVFFAVNSPAGVVGASASEAVRTISSWGFPVTAETMSRLAASVGEKTLFFRTGGAPSLALGMARILSSVGGDAILGFWYHFAIMFEALFILTVLDAGTRVGRFMLQDMLGHIYKPLGRQSSKPAALFTSALIVAAWGWFLYQGVRDPLGGINSLWPLFGIANQLLAAIALCVATTVLLKSAKGAERTAQSREELIAPHSVLRVFKKMHRARYVYVTGIPLLWLTVVTFTAGWQKIFSPSPALGFLAQARQLEALPAISSVVRMQILNARLDAALCALLMLLVAVVLLHSARLWTRILMGAKVSPSRETPFVLTQMQPERP